MNNSYVAHLSSGAKGDRGDGGPLGPVGQTGPQGSVGPSGPEGIEGPTGQCKFNPLIIYMSDHSVHLKTLLNN